MKNEKHPQSRPLAFWFIILGLLSSLSLSLFFYLSPHKSSELAPASPQENAPISQDEWDYGLQENNDGTQTFTSQTGYSLTIPSKYQPMKFQEMGKEHLREGKCEVVFTQGGMGDVSIQLVPYSHEPLRKLHSYDDTYDLRYEDVKIQARKALVVEAGVVGDSGSGSTMILPVNEHALIVSASYIAKDSADFKTILSSIAVDNLDVSKCGAQR